MLKILRHKKTAKKVWIFLALIIIPAFALWGFGGAFRSREENMPAGKIFGRAISKLELKDSLSAATTIAILQYGDKLPEIQKYLNLEGQAWQRLILLEEAKRRAIKASDAEVIQAIEALPYFQYKGGFDNKTYQQNLQYIFRLNPRQFEEQMRQGIILSKLYKQVTDNTKIDENAIGKEYEKLNQEISIYYISSLSADFIKDIKPSAGELNDYFSKNKDMFREPASFNIEYLVINSVVQVKEISELLNKKFTFAKIAQELKLQPKETGLFIQNSPAPGLEWLAENPEIISKLKTVECSPPVQVGDLYYLLKLKETKEAHTPEFKAVEQKVRLALINTGALKKAEQKINQCAKELKSRKFKQAAKKCGLKVKETAPFKFASNIEGIGAADIFWNTAKSLKDTENSEIIRLPSGFYIIKVKAISKIDPKKFEQEKAGFGNSLLEQKKQEKFREFLTGLNKKAQ
ncbi:MAG: peptidylprolyl isomerase [Candidatus Omnitrophica bacterium]|nr:peptidylprolyl isomerase [Candidatus Omnitrophota bacterium]